MSETQQVQNSTRSSENIEDALRRMKVNEENNMIEQSSLYPDRPGERDCQFFLRTGQCGYGNSCRYNHPLSHLPQGVFYHRDELPERIGQPDCEYFLKTGACKYGSTCKYHHPKDRNGAGPVLFNVLGYPMRQGEKSCPYYMQKGVCRFGVACKFHHPHPNPQPHNGHATTYGMSTFPSVGFPYAGGLPMMSLPPATYGGAMPRPQVPHPQAYMPFMVPPPPGLPPPHGWSTYMAGSNPIYNVKTQPDSSSSASVPVAVTPHHDSFSERAECRFFMNTGTCKYGDDCKYFHPKERMLPSPPNLLNHVALPARPGQPACGNFKAYGFCKYGANCKFDHPMPLNNPYENTGLAMPYLPTAYASPVSTRLPSRSDSTALSSGNQPAAEDQTSEMEKQVERTDKSEVQDPSQLNGSDSTALSNGNKPASSSDSTALSNGKYDAESPRSETKKQEDNPSQPDNSGTQGSSVNAS